MSNPFEQFKKSFQVARKIQELSELHRAAVEKVGEDRVRYGMQIVNQMWDHFQPKYGAERARIIIEKVAAPPPDGWNVDQLIHVGERWHVMNLYMHNKISAAELQEGIAAADRLPH